MDNAELIYRWFDEVWNQKSEAAIDELMAPDGVGHGLQDPAGGDKIIGPESFKRLHRAFVSAYPNIHVRVEDTVVQDDKVAARCTVSGTHSGDGLGLQPRNSDVEFTGMVILRVEDGKIAEAWNEFDFMKMYSQLGAVTLAEE